MSEQRSRPRIPDQIQRELWARAAGRCEFRGCNELLYKDELTQQRSNLAVISHIVAFSEDGPRGDPVRSKELEKDIRNLMLTCRVHGKIVDDKEKVSDYPEKLLLEFKREHEQRIRMLTEAKENAQTHVLLLQVSIDARDFQIDQTAAFRAILPYYPAEEDAWVIDLSGLNISAESDGFFQVTAESIAIQTREFLRRHPCGQSMKNISVFALAPVPLLVHFGHLLGDLHHIDLYQRHRDSQEWTWKTEEEAEQFYEVVEPDVDDDGRANIALILAVSTSIGREKVDAYVGEDAIVYEIRASNPSVDFLRSRKRLEMFGYEVRRLLALIREAHGHDRTVHLFASVPAPVAIEFGRAVKAFDPPFVIYEYQKANHRYIPALIINTHQT
ncbi:MAG: SAVED domain-containing protein [Chloroflexota bacterium]|nr:MAG: SAVED domain-containing protein [Chloroflexota bacterium]